MTANIPEPSTPPRAPSVESWRGTKPATSVGEGIAQVIEAAGRIEVNWLDQNAQQSGDRADVHRVVGAEDAYKAAARIAREFRAPVTEPVAVDEVVAGAGSFWTQAEWAEWSNQLANLLWEDDDARYANPEGSQESIIYSVFKVYAENHHWLQQLSCQWCEKPITPVEDAVPDLSITTHTRWVHRDCLEANA